MESNENTAARKLPPLHARLYWYKLTATEQAILKAMVEHCSNGLTIWVSLDRIAAYANVSVRTVQRIIHGCGSRGRHKPGLLKRGILTCLAPANSKGERKPATYRINEDALEVDPRMKPYMAERLQLSFPGIRRLPVPGEFVPDIGVTESRVTECRGTGDTVTPQSVTPCHGTGDTMSPDSLSDSRKGFMTRIRGDGAAPLTTSYLATLACQLLSDIGLPITHANRETVSAALESIHKAHGDPPVECLAWLKSRALAARDEGKPVNRFWFEDAKYLGDKDNANRADRRQQSNLRARDQARAAVLGARPTHNPGRGNG